MRLLLAAAAALVRLPVLPAADAIDPKCPPIDRNAWFVEAEVTYLCQVYVTFYHCEVDWYGGHGLLGGFYIHDCEAYDPLP